jgi:hypothetical protein
MILIAPNEQALNTAAELAEFGYEIGIAPEGRYLKAYPTTIPVEVA